MGFTEVLTIIFILLKVFGAVDWSWWIVFLPEIIAVVFYVFLYVVQVSAFKKASKKMDKHFDNFWKGMGK